MFQKILYPTDFSDVSQKALTYVKGLRAAGAQEVVVVHIIDQRKLEMMKKVGTVTADTTDTAIAIKEAEVEHVDAEIAKVEEELTKAGFAVTKRVELDIPFRGILKVEDEENTSVTVIGSHGVSNIAEMLLGSVSERVIRKAKKPIIVVKRDLGDFES